MLSPGASCSASSAAADRYRPSSSSAKRLSSLAPSADTGSPIHAGVNTAARRMSTPTTDSVRPRSRAGSTSGTSSSSMGLASATRSSAATRPNTSSLNPSRGPTMVASACPVTCRTAEENSASAEALIRCTA
jgi:phosphate-selective porin